MRNVPRVLGQIPAARGRGDTAVYTSGGDGSPFQQEKSWQFFIMMMIIIII